MKNEEELSKEKKEFSKETILEVITCEIEKLKKQIEPQKQNLDKKFN